MAVPAASHPAPALTMSPRYVNSLTISTSSQLYFLLHCLSNIDFSFLHVIFVHDCGVTLFTPAHLPWIPFLLYHTAHKTELAFTLKLQKPHGSSLLLDVPSFVMPPLTIILIFPMFFFKPLLCKASFNLRTFF